MTVEDFRLSRPFQLTETARFPNDLRSIFPLTNTKTLEGVSREDRITALTVVESVEFR